MHDDIHFIQSHQHSRIMACIRCGDKETKETGDLLILIPIDQQTRRPNRGARVTKYLAIDQSDMDNTTEQQPPILSDAHLTNRQTYRNIDWKQAAYRLLPYKYSSKSNKIKNIVSRALSGRDWETVATRTTATQHAISSTFHHGAWSSRTSQPNIQHLRRAMASPSATYIIVSRWRDSSNTPIELFCVRRSSKTEGVVFIKPHSSWRVMRSERRGDAVSRSVVQFMCLLGFRHWNYHRSRTLYSINRVFSANHPKPRSVTNTCRTAN
jgi:hypothetical protein